MTEKLFERAAVKWLKEQGATVVKNRAGPGVPLGFPDRTIIYRHKYGLIEFKRSKNAPYRVGQKETLDFHGKYNMFVYTAYPENWEAIQQELLRLFFEKY